MTKNELFKQVKVRDYVEKNYHAVWYDLNTLRFGEGANKELEPDRAEFYDVCITTMCNADCPFCYAKAARGKGMHYSKICDTWKKWMDLFPKDEKIEGTTAIRTHKPLQIAIGVII